MTLAGNMKLRTFLVAAVLVVAGGITASYVACSSSAPSAVKADAKPAPVILIADAARPPVAPPPSPVTSSDLVPRPYDADVIAWRAKPLASGKGKDVSKGRPWKLNIYADDGKTVNRAKVDANRNNKFDDKYTFKGDQIVLEHAPADDEHYTESYVWNGTGWTKR